MALAPEQARTFKNQTLLKEFISDLKQICASQLKMNLSPDSSQQSAKADQNQDMVALSYNMQF